MIFKYKSVAYLYARFINLIKTDKVKWVPISQKVMSNIIAVLRNQNCIHHCHINGEIVGNSHTFCNQKVRENYYKIPVVAHNLFRFDFFFLMKGLRASIWQTRDITIRGKNPTGINFATIGNQVQLIDTIKYFQQSLGGLGGSLTSSEKIEIRRQCHSFLLSQPILYIKFMKLGQEDQDWVLEYLFTGKGVILYPMITEFDSLIISPEKEFFSQHLFYSGLKDSQISTEDYENVKKFYTLMKL